MGDILTCNLWLRAIFGANLKQCRMINSEKSDFAPVSYEQVHEISNNVVCATSKASDQPAHTLSLIRAFASRLNSL